MVTAMIALAENLGMTPLAEGIETEGEWRFLADHGCTLGQGYHFSRPVPPDEILTLHRRATACRRSTAARERPAPSGGAWALEGPSVGRACCR